MLDWVTFLTTFQGRDRRSRRKAFQGDDGPHPGAEGAVQRGGAGRPFRFTAVRR